MPKESQSAADIVSQVLEILGISDSNQRESMLEEVNQFIQLKAGQSMLLGLPEETQKELSKLSEEEVAAALPQNLPEEKVKEALEKAVEETIPSYVAELTQTATSEQKEKIEALLDSIK